MKIYFTAQYEHPSGESIAFQSDWIDDHYALSFISDFERTGRFAMISIHDDLGQQWSTKEFKKLMAKSSGAAKDISLHFDATYFKAGSTAGLGWTIEYVKDGESFIEKRNKKISQIQSNNEAEYAALYYALEHALKIAEGFQQVIRCYGDALTVTNQMSGEWPCYDQELSKWADRIDLLLSNQKMTADYLHIGRTQNKPAHKLAQQAMDQTDIKSLNRNDKDE
ncbi:reverse transcriptase-like protein [Jeotgalibacillus malaysiensis]|uniref:reverse transcriptase-like protein n=1 Tax=Jeotgalibacillus malaysiensis TaxID=1508404 RepID=UPI00384DC456